MTTDRQTDRFMLSVGEVILFDPRRRHSLVDWVATVAALALTLSLSDDDLRPINKQLNSRSLNWWWSICVCCVCFCVCCKCVRVSVFFLFCSILKLYICCEFCSKVLFLFLNKLVDAFAWWLTLDAQIYLSTFMLMLFFS